MKGYKNSFRTTGPIRVLSTLTIFTGYFQDRLNPSVTFVWEWETDSGAVLASIDYRYTEKFRIVLGVNAFAGDLDKDPMSITPSSLENSVGEDRFRDFTFDGIQSARHRDEVFLRLRYTF